MREREAGRALDAEIAENVFGYNVTRASTGWWLTDEPHDRGGRLVLRRYSTDIAIAWSVIGKMCEIGWPYCHVQQFVEEGDADHATRVAYWCTFERYRSPIQASSPHVDTASLAICLAALAALAALDARSSSGDR